LIVEWLRRIEVVGAICVRINSQEKLMRVAVLGGGLQGACVALELAANGIEVDLYEKNERCLSRASAHNEGKIHLGYVYANDPTMQTARVMARGALRFSSLMRRWIGDAIDAIPVSEPFYYVVHRQSLLDVSEIENHLRATHAIVREESRDFSNEYFGSDFRDGPIRISDYECESLFSRQTVVAAFWTPEIGIDSETLAGVMGARLSSERRICCRLQTSVCSVQLANGHAWVEFETGGQEGREAYDHVVNALWDGRLAIDRTAGFEPPRPWLYRIKHYLRMKSSGNDALPTTTIVLGPFGDIVTYNNGEVFLSWYPVGLRGISAELAPPAWPLDFDLQTAREVRDGILAGLAAVVPAVADLKYEAIKSCQLKAGVIFAWGSTDIPDCASGLHARYAIGPQSHGRYHSVDTGKLTMAPYFAKMTADRIVGNG
jgi:glycine/D-amino acid oxidase-like deaminating enzyme